MDDTTNINDEAVSAKAREQCYRACYEDRAVQAREQCNAIERAFLQPTLSSIFQTDFEKPNVDKQCPPLVAYADLRCYRALT